jgi:DNA-binding NarL/FixJ family response regulator
MNESVQKDILHELRLIKRLLAQNLLVGKSQTLHIAKLHSIGLKPKEIAEIVGTSANTVNVTLNRQRKSHQKR